MITGQDRPRSAPWCGCAGRATPTRCAQRCEKHNAGTPQSSTRIGRVLVLTEPPSIDGSEITDKGYINQRAVLERRADDVARLHAGRSRSLDPPVPGHAVVTDGSPTSAAANVGMIEANRR